AWSGAAEFVLPREPSELICGPGSPNPIGAPPLDPTKGRALDRGRDAHYWAPPAQIRQAGLPLTREGLPPAGTRQLPGASILLFNRVLAVWCGELRSGGCAFGGGL